MISCIVVNYRCAHLTLGSVHSILSQDEDVEILVVDNSEDEAEAQTLRDRLPPAVTLSINAANEGFARACNRAYRQSSGDMVLLLNPDARLFPEALGHLRRTLLSRADAGAVGPRIYWDDGKRFLLPPSLFPCPRQMLKNELWRLHPALGDFASHSFRRRALRAWQGKRAFADSALSGGSVLLRRSAVEKSGGLFDERFFMYFEDSDLMLRLARSGYRLYVEPSAEIVHYYEQSPWKSELMIESSPLYFEKNYGKSRLLRWAGKMAMMPPRRIPEFEPLGALSDPPSFAVPPALDGKWLMEISPSHLFIPAIGCFGSGEKASIPGECWRLLHPGRYYCRIGSPDASPREIRSWTWEIIA